MLPTLDLFARSVVVLALAYASGVEGPFVVATDARRKEVYWARYEGPRARVTDPAVDRPGAIADEVAGVPAVGAGVCLLLFLVLWRDKPGKLEDEVRDAQSFPIEPVTITPAIAETTTTSSTRA